ncbi:dihydrolipoamide acetyltransferase [Fragilaria crotonensis]|nr:dihydrolipoamide acetyltransferase [Fragilaria crotonensis]
MLQSRSVATKILPCRRSVCHFALRRGLCIISPAVVTTTVPENMTVTSTNRSFSSIATANQRLFEANIASTRHCRYKSSLPIDDDDYQNKSLIPFLLADIGEGIAEVEVLQWFVEPGEQVKQFDKVCEVQSDKANVEITSRFDGVVESLADSSQMVRVGTPLMHLWVERTNDADKATTVAPMHNVDVEQDKLHIPTFASSYQTNKVSATPAVRKLGMEYSLDLGNVVGSGPNGRVLKSDVLQMLQQSGRIATPKNTDDKQSSTYSGQLTTNPTIENTELTKVPTQGERQDETVPIRGYNRLMVKTMTESLSIPHMCYADEINMNQVLQARKSVDGIKLSILPFAVKAASLGMTDYPVLNSSLNLQEMTITYHANHNIGVAMDTPRGLAVPVVKECQNLSIVEIAQELDRLKVAAAGGNLSEADISGATFTLSNIGAIGGTYMSPIVASPQVAIGAMGKIQRLPRFVGDAVEGVNIMQISWGGDHRVIDGATMARFSNRWKELMENPMAMVFRMK